MITSFPSFPPLLLNNASISPLPWDTATEKVTIFTNVQYYQFNTAIHSPAFKKNFQIYKNETASIQFSAKISCF